MPYLESVTTIFTEQYILMCGLGNWTTQHALTYAKKKLSKHQSSSADDDVGDNNWNCCPIGFVAGKCEYKKLTHISLINVLISCKDFIELWIQYVLFLIKIKHFYVFVGFYIFDFVLCPLLV